MELWNAVETPGLFVKIEDSLLDNSRQRLLCGLSALHLTGKP